MAGAGSTAAKVPPREFFRSYESTFESAFPNGQTSDRSSPPTSPTHPTPSTSYPGQSSSTTLTPEMVTEVNRILNQGHRLGIEFVDGRRFRTGSWTSYGSYEGNGAAAIAALEACLSDHVNDYVRLVGVNPKDRRRMVETIIHRP